MSNQLICNSEGRKVSLVLETERKVKESATYLLGMLESIKQPLKVACFGPNKSGNLGKTQFQNLLRTTMKSAGIPELQLYIHYQVGRSKRNQGWATPVKGSKEVFGEEVVNVLERIKQKSSELAPDWNETEQRSLALKLTERFFTYVIWYVTFEDSKQESQKGGHQK